MTKAMVIITDGYMTLDDVLQAFRNLGHDTNCGACMEIAFTGLTLAPHDCDNQNPSVETQS